MKHYMILPFLAALVRSYLNYSIAQYLAPNNAPNYYFEMLSPNYMVCVQIKQNLNNSSVNLYDVWVQSSGNFTLLLENVIGYVDMEVFVNSTTQNINLCIATKTRITTYDEDLSEIKSLTISSNLWIYGIKYCPLYDIIYYLAYNISISEYQTGKFDTVFTPLFSLLDSTFDIWVKDDKIYSFMDEMPNGNNSAILVYNSLVNLISLPDKYSYSDLYLPLFVNQNVIYPIDLQVFFSTDNQTLFFSTDLQIIYFNHSSQTVINTLTFANTPIIALAQCAAELFTITEWSGTFILSKWSIPTFAFIESVTIPASPHFELICSNDHPFIFPIGQNFIYQVELVDPILNSTSVNATNQTLNITAANITNSTFNVSKFTIDPVPALQPLPEPQPVPQPELIETPYISEEVQSAIAFIESPETKTNLMRTASATPILLQVGGKSYLKFFNSMIDFFFPYKFHERNYTQFLFFFSQEMDVLAEFRIKPSFLSDINPSGFFSFEENDSQFKSQVKYSGEFQPSIYFLQSSKDFLIVSIPVCLAIFFLLYLGRILLFKLKIKNRLFEMIYFQLFLATKWWMLIVSILDTNLTVNVFFTFIQMKAAFSFTFWDKVNFSSALLLNLVYIAYTVIFYPLLYSSQRRNITKEVISDTKFHFKGFFLISLLGAFNNFVRSAIHACFLENGLIGLLLESIGMIVICLLLRKMFRNWFILLLTVASFALIGIFDFHLYLLSAGVPDINFETWSFVLMMMILGMSIFRNMTIIAFDLKEFISDCRNKNKVKDENIENDNNNKVRVQEINEDFIAKRSQHFLKSFKKKQVIFDMEAQNNTDLHEKTNESILKSMKSSVSHKMSEYQRKIENLEREFPTQ